MLDPATCGPAFIALPQDEMRDIVTRFTGAGGRRGAPPPDASYYRAWLESLRSLDFDRPEAAWIRAIYLAYLTAVGSSLGWVLHRDPDTYRYIPASIRRYPGSRGVAALMRTAGFEGVKFRQFRALSVALFLNVTRRGDERCSPRPTFSEW